MPTATRNSAVMAGGGRIKVVGDSVRSLPEEERAHHYEFIEELRERPLERTDVMIYDPLYTQYEYGPNGTHEPIIDPLEGNIKIGCDASGQTAEPRVWVGPADHALLPGLRRARPDLVLFFRED